MTKPTRVDCRRAAVMGAVLGAVALTAGCSSSKKEDVLNCPLVEAVPDADLYPDFGRGTGRAVTDVIVGGKITSVKSSCKREAHGIAVDALVSISSTRIGPLIKSANLPYFVVVTDINHDVLAQEAFNLKVDFFPGENFRSYEEPITVHIPVKSANAGGDYAVVVGFQLTKDQMDFNRAHHQAE